MHEPWKSPVRTQQEGGHLRARNRALTRNLINWNLDLGLLALRTVRNKFLLVKSLSRWYFVIVAQTDTVNISESSMAFQERLGILAQ